MKNRIFLTLIYLTLSFSLWGKEKVLIITSAYNRADFIEWQQKSFKKFLKDDYELVVFSDATNQKHRDEIKEMCEKYSLRFYQVPNAIHQSPYLHREPADNFNHPAIRNCNVVMYALAKIGFDHEGIVAIFDSDLFLTKECSFNDLLINHDLLGIAQSRGGVYNRVDYLWIGLCIMNTKTMPNKRELNFNCGRINDIPVDAGGYSHYYLKNENPKVYYMDMLHAGEYSCSICETLIKCPHIEDQLLNTSLDKNQKALIQKGLPSGEFFHNGTFFHYSGGTNWDHKSPKYHKTKSELVKEYMETILEEAL